MAKGEKKEANSRANTSKRWYWIMLIFDTGNVATYFHKLITRSLSLSLFLREMVLYLCVSHLYTRT